MSAPPPLLESLAAFPARDAAARDAAVAAGLPTQRHERWKYTALRALGARRFAAAAPAPAVHPGVLEDVPSPRLVFVNGRFDAALSRLDGLPAGVTLQAGATRAEPGSTPAPGAGHVFTALNAALAATGAQLDVPAGTHAPALHLAFVSTPAGADLALHLRHRLVLGAGARAVLVEHHLATGAHRHLANHVLALELGDGADLLHARLQDEDPGATLFARSEATLGANARYRRVDLELGAALSRHELAVVLAGEGARFESGGALLAAGRRHLDTRLEVRHAARDAACDLRWRGLAADRARLAFHGGIRIDAGADGAAAALSSKNLLLSDQAEVATQPVLEIDADEVQAAHGATVGRLDPTALFYLRSRGLGEAEARALLTLAFCREAPALAGDPALEALLAPRLEARLLALDGAAA